MIISYIYSYELHSFNSPDSKINIKIHFASNGFSNDKVSSLIILHAVI